MHDHADGEPKVALITGITGQDGSYLTELLLAKGYRVHGVSRAPVEAATKRLKRVLEVEPGDFSRITLHAAELGESDRIFDLVQRLRPNEIYHLGAQSHVGQSFEAPFETLDANARGTLAILDAVRRLQTDASIRVYQASTSELFGKPRHFPQTEETPFHPRNPYACSKAYAFDVSVCYREAYGVYVSNGIQYNHESPRRSLRFVSRKIVHAAARIAAGLDDRLVLGTLDVGRDWGYAPEYVEAMWLMLQQPEAEDYVIGTNEWHPLSELLEIAFERVGLEWRDYVRTDSHLARPAETGRLQGDYTKACTQLGWRPKTSFRDLINLMVDADVRVVQQEQSTP